MVSKWLMSLCVAFPSVVFLSLGSLAAKPPRLLKTEGYFFGGEAVGGVTLLSLKKQMIKNGSVERYLFEFGDRKGKPLLGRPGYFHVELRKNPPVLLVDLAQVANTRVEQGLLSEVLKGSKFLSQGKLTADAEDGSHNFQFQLKQPVSVRVYQVAGKREGGKLIIDVSK